MTADEEKVTTIIAYDDTRPKIQTVNYLGIKEIEFSSSFNDCPVTSTLFLTDSPTAITFGESLSEVFSLSETFDLIVDQQFIKDPKYNFFIGRHTRKGQQFAVPVTINFVPSLNTVPEFADAPQTKFFMNETEEASLTYNFPALSDAEGHNVVVNWDVEDVKDFVSLTFDQASGVIKMDIDVTGVAEDKLGIYQFAISITDDGNEPKNAVDVELELEITKYIPPPEPEALEEGEEGEEGETGGKIGVRKKREIPQAFANVDPAMMEMLIKRLQMQQMAEENGEVIEEPEKKPI